MMRFDFARVRGWMSSLFFLGWGGGLAAGLVAGCSGGGGGGSSEPLALLSVDTGRHDLLALNQVLTFHFSREIDPTTVTPDSIRIRRKPSLAIGARGRFEVSGSTVTFIPEFPSDLRDASDAGFERGAQYDVEVVDDKVPSVRSTGGRPLEIGTQLTLRMSPANPPFFTDLFPGPPHVMASSPTLSPDFQEPVGELQVDGAVEIELSEPIHPDSLEDRSIFLSLLDGNGVARLIGHRATVLQDAVSARLRIEPLRILPGGTMLEVSLGSRIRDLGGNFLTPFRGRVQVGPSGGYTGALVEGFETTMHLEASESTADWDGERGWLAATLGPGGDRRHGDLILLDEDRILETGEAEEFHFGRLVVSPGRTLRIIGPAAATVFVADEAVIQGDVDISGLPAADALGNDAPGSSGGVGGPGGGRGGTGGSLPDDRGRIEGFDGDGPLPGLAPLSGGGRGGDDSRSLGGGGGGGGGANGDFGADGINGAGFGGAPIGDPSLDPAQGFLLGGGGGGGGAADNDLVPEQNDGGSGGGGGGGALRIVSSDRIEMSGRLIARGGAGGRNPGAGGAGGGGAGGSLLLQGRTVDVPVGAQIDVSGGEGGRTGGFGHGGVGGRGRVRIEDADSGMSAEAESIRPPLVEEEWRGTYVLSRGRGVSFARSRFLAPRVLSPDYHFEASDPQSGRVLEFGESVLTVGALPEGVEVFVRFEGAPQLDLDPSLPDLDRRTGFVTDIDRLDGLPFLRFEIEFRLPEALDPFGVSVALDGIRILYSER